MNPFDANLEDLRNKFVMGAQGRLRRIRDSVRRLEDAPSDTAALGDAMRHFHGLAGAAATYGFPDVAGVARGIEQACTVHINRGTAPGAAEIESWRRDVSRLRREFGMASSGMVLQVEARAPEGEVRRVLILAPHSGERDMLARLLATERIQVRVASDRAAARRVLREQLPDAVVIDLAAQGGTGVQVIETLRTIEGGPDVPVLVRNSPTAQIDRVEAARLGAHAVLAHDARPEQVADRLRSLLSRVRAHRNTILCVESDADQAAYIQRLLEAAGHNVEICRKPDDVEPALLAHTPELLLVEAVLPGVGGVELVRVLRLDPRFQHLSVIFITTPNHMPERLDSGPDAWLVKPVEPRILLSTVSGCIERARLAASVGERDGLTGLYNHSTFVRRLESWMASGEPHRRPSCLALIDIDGLAALNTRYGHHVGDHLLRHVGRLVQRHVPSGQLAARYGSDEFILMLHDLNEAECAALLTGIADEFLATTRYTPDGRTFSASFCAGVAPLDHTWHKPNLWLAEVEHALSQARRAGPGKIATADGNAARFYTT